jgi:hypothetical protein
VRRQLLGHPGATVRPGHPVRVCSRQRAAYVLMVHCDMLDCFARTRMNALAIGHYLVTK